MQQISLLLAVQICLLKAGLKNVVEKAGVCQYRIQQLDTQRMPHPDEASSARPLSAEEPQFLENAPRNWEYESGETMDDSFEQKPTRQELVERIQQLEEQLRQVFFSMEKMKSDFASREQMLKQENLKLKRQLKRIKEKYKKQEEEQEKQGEQSEEQQIKTLSKCIDVQLHIMPQDLSENFNLQRQQASIDYDRYFMDNTEVKKESQKKEQGRPSMENTPESLQYSAEEGQNTAQKKIERSPSPE